MYPWFLSINNFNTKGVEEISSKIALNEKKSLHGMLVKIVFVEAQRNNAELIAKRIVVLGGTTKLSVRKKIPSEYSGILIVNRESQIGAARLLRDKISDIKSFRLRRSAPHFLPNTGLLSIVLWVD